MNTYFSILTSTGLALLAQAESTGTHSWILNTITPGLLFPGDTDSDGGLNG